MGKVVLSFGVMGEPLAEQLRAQGLTADATKLAKIQRALEARQYLSIHGYLTEAETDRVVKRLGKAVFALLDPPSPEQRDGE